MSRPVKGGVWTNTEDEILKVAFMKYGKNQWARISSLLVRKTPKQCKARWYEWVDPSIKKTEWTKEEEEKLLHLAKILPSQWQTIASIVGRTPYQCLEHYEQMLDAAQTTFGDGQVVDSASLRALRPGEVDVAPETKPARPDPVDMDEDEKEMLSEARARLANTQGKKAKRKAREKLLEEARRLSALQKKRELKEAGITTRIGGFRIRKGINYNIDIPFQRKPPPGFFDTTEEQEREKQLASKETNPLSKPAPVRRRMADEVAARKKDSYTKKMLSKQGKLTPAEIARLKKLSQEQFRVKRSSLSLPDPLVSQSDVQELMKMGVTTQDIGETPSVSLTPRSIIESSMDRSSEATRVQLMRQHLSDVFSTLPAPLNNYELTRD